ncbi:hypothetical protein ACH4SP_42335 [Streptomyces sp. NPDC021093]|uniref:hypothetical protein n=1 Tax=Streptomyces sp. NPDC021093 TaxID=3365112 RepID=UPI0037BB3658
MPVITPISCRERLVQEELETHAWFASRPFPAMHRSHPDEIIRVLRDELKDCGTWVDVQPVPLEPFPTSRQSYDELFAVSRDLLGLLRRALLEAAPTRQGRLDALGGRPGTHSYPLFVDDDEFELRHCAAMARPDVVIGRDGPRFLEFNVSGAFGGPTEAHGFGRAWTRLYGGVGSSLPFTMDDPFSARADLFEKVCAELGVPKAVALVGNRVDRRGETTRYFDGEAAYLRGRGFLAEVVEPGALPEAIGRPGSLRFPLALRYFAPADWVSRGESLDAVRALIAVGCVLYPPESSYLLANKRLLARLSKPHDWMSDSDRRLVQRYVPWTRLARDGKVDWRGEWEDLRRLLTVRRESFVIKPAVGMMGHGVVIGRFRSPTQWEADVTQVLDSGNAIVQEYVEPARYELEMAAEPGTEPYRASVAPVLSPLLFGGRPGGIYARYYPDGRSGVVGVAQGGAMENVVLPGSD